MDQTVFHFLQELAQNNNREWFAEQKVNYEAAKEQAYTFFESVFRELTKEDDLNKFRMYRIYRDVRFSKDKSPYKNHFGAIYSRRQPHNRGSFYIHLEPGNVFIGAGFWNPEKDDLLRIRKAIEMEDDLELILDDKRLQKEFGGLQGEALKTAPKGFDKVHPRMELIRFKQFLLTKKYSEKDVLAKDLVQKIAADYQVLIPFFEYMTSVLTTDENGEPLF